MHGTLERRKTIRKEKKPFERRNANPNVENTKMENIKMGKPKMKKKSEKAKNRKMKSGKVKNQKRKNQIIKNKLLKIISKLVPNIIKAISPRLESEILNEIIRLILSKAELV